jgi:hypothetical protein
VRDGFACYDTKVTVGTADKLLSGECGNQCVGDCVDFLNYCGYLIKHRAGTTIYNHKAFGERVACLKSAHAVGFVGIFQKHGTQQCASSSVAIQTLTEKLYGAVTYNNVL